MSDEQRPISRDSMQADFLTHAEERIETLIPESMDELRDAANDYALALMIGLQVPQPEAPTLRDKAEKLSPSFLAPFREANQMALGLRVLDAVNAVAAQYAGFKAPGSGRA